MTELDEDLRHKLELKARKAEARYADLRRQVDRASEQHQASRARARVRHLVIIGIVLALMDSCQHDEQRFIKEVAHDVANRIQIPMSW